MSKLRIKDLVLTVLVCVVAARRERLGRSLFLLFASFWRVACSCSLTIPLSLTGIEHSKTEAITTRSASLYTTVYTSIMGPAASEGLEQPDGAQSAAVPRSNARKVSTGIIISLVKPVLLLWVWEAYASVALRTIDNTQDFASLPSIQFDKIDVFGADELPQNDISVAYPHARLFPAKLGSVWPADIACG